ncbi:MAG TPA: LytS/YhcK type 5TM receptor domain-containing protein [Bacillota bacterium]|nr:LytS/YhcK type 5TM receptor domain-containing protein [Bacillota bacterium]
MFLLLVELLERVGFLIGTAFLFSQSKWMRRYMDYERNPQNQWRFIALFSFFAILGTYSGVTVTELNYRSAPLIGSVSDTAAIANSRTVGVVIAGLLGGIKPGIIVGVIAGIHRYSLGGFVAFSCMLSPILQGILAGFMKPALQKRYRHISSVQLAFIIGFLAESLQMLLIIVLTKLRVEAYDLVSLIGVPQIIANSVGVALFFMLYMEIKNEEERIGAKHALQVLKIADKTLPLWTKPLEEAVTGVAEILVDETNAVGALFEMEKKIIVMKGKTSLFSFEVPLHSGKKKMGVFRVFYERELELGATNQILMKGLTQLFSQQAAIVENERQAQLLADVEIRALQAQMNPHFLFNVLNTVKSFIRTKPDEARKMITQLAKFLRQGMQVSSSSLISLGQELDYVDAYLNLVQARMGERIIVERRIDQSLVECRVPPLSIQPLVENAIVHGLSKMNGHGLIILNVQKDGDRILISVEDNGQWIEIEHRGNKQDHMGFALDNLAQRLRFHYGFDHGIHIDTNRNPGTKVSFWVR